MEKLWAVTWICSKEVLLEMCLIILPLAKHASLVPEGDFVAESDAGMYYVSVDPSGKLGWESNILTYNTTTAHVLEVLTNKASNAYKAFLRKLNISYIIVGEDSLDYTLLMEKLSTLFKIETLMLGGGGVLNWSFIGAGLCDELSLVMAADSPVIKWACKADKISIYIGGVDAVHIIFLNTGTVRMFSAFATTKTGMDGHVLKMEMSDCVAGG